MMMTTDLLARPWWDRHFPGLALAGAVALAAQFLADHYGAPAILMAILPGLALHGLSEEGKAAPGLDLAAGAVLRIGVALLGLRNSGQMFLDLGLSALALVPGGVALTIAFGIAAARLLGQYAAFGFLTGGAVATCGASAAMAIAAVLPRRAGDAQPGLYRSWRHAPVDAGDDPLSDPCREAGLRRDRDRPVPRCHHP
jgi:uncharacterized membrane protein YadS